jgi:hypothetical protein
MKLFESKYFNLCLILSFILSLFVVSLFGCLLGIAEIPNLIASSILMFISTLIAISLPLHAAYKNNEESKNTENKKVYITVSSYVGGEILDNVIEIQDVLINNKKTLDNMDAHTPPLSERQRKTVLASIWKAAADSLFESLEDKHHKSMVNSGLVGKIPDEPVAEGIRDTYQKMDNLKKRLKNMSKFLEMLLTPQGDVPESFISFQFDTKLQEAISAAELDIKIFNDSAEKTRIEINKVLKPYGKEIKIVTYEEQISKPRGGARKTKRRSTSSTRRTKNS